MTNIYSLSSKRKFWNNYTSREENVSHVPSWRSGGTILSGSFFIIQREASAKGRRIVILKTSGSKAHFGKNQYKSKNTGQVSQTSRKIYLPKYKKTLLSSRKTLCRNMILMATDNMGSLRSLQNSWMSLDHCGDYRTVGQLQITQTMFNNRLSMALALSLGK